MRYIIKDEKLNDDVVELYLEQFENNNIYLRAKDWEGLSWTLLRISPDGKFFTVGSVDKELGFEVNGNGELKIHWED